MISLSNRGKRSKMGFKSKIVADTICCFIGHNRKKEFIDPKTIDQWFGFEEGSHTEDVPIFVCDRCKRTLGFA